MGVFEIVLVLHKIFGIIEIRTFRAHSVSDLHMIAHRLPEGGSITRCLFVTCQRNNRHEDRRARHELTGAPMLRSPPRQLLKEYLDTPGQNPAELRGLLHDIQRTNRRFGGDRLILGYLSKYVHRIKKQPLTILDVATASADIPRAIVEWARTRHLVVRISAIDLNPEILAIAQADLEDYEEITLTRADATALPFADRTFDVVICGLALHHFADIEAIRLLQEIDRVTRGPLIINDIVRSWGALAGVWLDTHLLSRNRLARHDGPLSVLRAYTAGEVRGLVAAAELEDVELHHHPLFRIALVRWPA